MSNKTQVVERKGHTIPRCLVDFMEKLESADGVIRVGVGPFGDKSKYVVPLEWTVQGMIKETKTVRLSVRYKEFGQDYWVTVDSTGLPKLANFLTNYSKSTR
jgi:hypothetical protein